MKKFDKNNLSGADNAPSSDDSTVIMKADKTRIKPVTHTGHKVMPENNDVTRFKQPVSAQNPDVTRIPPKTSTLNQVDPANPGSQTIQHQVLKQRFLLEKVLGVGGMGVVYKAKDKLKVEAQDRDPYVAIKVLSEEFKTHPEAFISLQRESRKSQRIAHPNTVKVYDFDRDGDVVFMTMEYMEGKPLDQLIRQYKATGLASEDAWNIIDGMCSALIHAHSENIVHSDFKPGNVFITNNNMAKIFDFGIARAVASVDKLDHKSGEMTVFDAGNLGALTPAYASLEMMLGEKPDYRDDIYALGCVIYEIFTGEHPFNKMPADEAFKRGLKPKRISRITKRQWKAIEKSLAFKRENRTESVEQLYKELTYSYKPGFKTIVAMTLLLSVSVAVLYQAMQKEPEHYSENDIRNELEYKIRFDLHQKELKKLISNPTFTLEWEDSVWDEFSSLSKLLNNSLDPGLVNTRRKIYSLYLSKIHEFISGMKLSRVKILIDNGYRYSADHSELDKQKQLLAAAIEKQKHDREIALRNRQKREIARIEKVKEKKAALDTFKLALANVNQQLQCQGALDMRDLDIAVTKLHSVDTSRYLQVEPKIVNTLAGCITQIGKVRAERAAEYKKYAKRIFRNNIIISEIKIIPKDACDLSIAGLGARGKRTICHDKINAQAYGPSLVVIPGNQNIKPFAIGKYEISVRDINMFCRSSKQCAEINSENDLPVVSIPFSTAKSYMRWLSKVTHEKYRLPTLAEWLYAAKSSHVVRDPNRNCQLSSRGISKGNSLINTTTGKQNPWGVVNYIGNAREWVYGNGRSLYAVGGSFQDPMDNCDLTLASLHNGQADKISGFRVLREVKKR